ncbi:hypothetical protein ACTD5D_21660 [Nocardia takedensis]|uniref:hypothetical protein n=1 Tax=Nocardia takedensis TaxID=259390 RepID=UPI003F762011
MSDSSAANPSEYNIKPRMVLEPWPDGLSTSLAERAEELINNEWVSLAEAVLHAHLLLEQALTERIRQKLLRPEVLDGGSLARLGFAQLLTVYAGLYAPKLKDLQLLQAFNRLRNRIAHTLNDPERLIRESLKALTPDSPAAPPDLLSSHFLYLFMGELMGVRGVHWHDPDGQRAGAQSSIADEGQRVCDFCGKR